jgi:hypothetical protein
MVFFLLPIGYFLIILYVEEINITSANIEWVADTVTMTCKNTTNNIVVLFEKLGKSLTGKIINLPLELINKWAVEKTVEIKIRNALKEAEEIFFRAYFNNDYEISEKSLEERGD